MKKTLPLLFMLGSCSTIKYEKNKTFQVKEVVKCKRCEISALPFLVIFSFSLLFFIIVLTKIVKKVVSNCFY